jgi:assimilatory nitrate reductase catalytic subunit
VQSAGADALQLGRAGPDPLAGHAQFAPTVLAAAAEQTDGEFSYLMLTGRIRDQWHTMTRTG